MVLDQTFPNQWIERNGPVSHQGPQISQSWIFSFGVKLKNEMIKERIKEARWKIKGELLDALSSFPRRIQKCLEIIGGNSSICKRNLIICIFHSVSFSFSADSLSLLTHTHTHTHPRTHARTHTQNIFTPSHGYRRISSIFHSVK